jgi:hypothetical protein
VPDLQRSAARLLRVALGVGGALVALGIILGAAGAAGPGRLSTVVGVAVVVAAPFATLITIAVEGRKTATALYATASLALAILGLLFAA